MQVVYLDEVDRPGQLKKQKEGKGSPPAINRSPLAGFPMLAQQPQANQPCNERVSWGGAVRLRQETTLSAGQIAACLHLGTPGSASVCLLASMKNTNANARTQARLRTGKGNAK